MLEAGNRIAVARRSAGGDQDIARTHACPVGQANRVRVEERGASFDDLDARSRQGGAVSGFEPGDLAVLVGDQRGPVERCAWQRPAKACGIFEFGMKARGVDQKLLGHTAADHTGAAEPVFLGEHDARPMLGGNPGGANAAGPASDHEKVDVSLGHRHISCPRFFISARILPMTSSDSLSAQLPANPMLSSAAFGSSLMTFWPSGDW